MVTKAFGIDEILGQGISKEYGPPLVDISKAFFNPIKAFKATPVAQLGRQYTTAARSGLEEGGFTGMQDAASKVAQETGGAAAARSALKTSTKNVYDDAIRATEGQGGNAALVGAGLVGAGAAAVGGRKLFKWGVNAAKAKAKKAALYGAAGIGGTAALGSYLGSTAANR